MTAGTPDSVARLLERPAVREARRLIFEDDSRTLEVQSELTEIPAPPFGEDARARRMAELFRGAGLADVRRDDEGNVLAELAGVDDAPPLLLSAHLDTVFPEGTEIRVRHDQASNRWIAPGIADDARGLAGLWAVARALAEARVSVAGAVRFVATVGEEGSGDLRGAKRLFAPGGAGRPCRGFVSLDGAGLRRLVIRGLGVRRLRLTVRGPGGHSWVDRGAPNPIHALGACVGELARISPPARKPAALTVARWSGGASINAVPREAWVELDLRSESENPLRALEDEVRSIAGAAVAAENARERKTDEPLRLDVEVIGDRPVGAADPDAPLIQAAVDATRAAGYDPELVASSSDSNVPMSLGIPAVTMGAGGEAGKAHTPEEWYRNEEGPEGILRALLTALLVVGLADG